MYPSRIPDFIPRPSGRWGLWIAYRLRGAGRRIRCSCSRSPAGSWNHCRRLSALVAKWTTYNLKNYVMYVLTKAVGVFKSEDNQQPYQISESIEETHLSTFQYRRAEFLYRVTLQALLPFATLTQDTRSCLGQLFF